MSDPDATKAFHSRATKAMPRSSAAKALADSDATRAFLEELNKGGDSAIAEAFERYFDWLQRLAARKMGRHVRAEPESIAMSVMGSLIRGIRDRRFRFANSRKLRNLLVTVTLNKIRNRAAKRSGVTLPTDFIELLGREPNQEDLAIVEDLIETALAGLESPYPEILSMRLAGYTQEEIAERLKMTRSAVRSRLDRIISRLRKLLEEPDKE
jgi:RNA polymerase sigma factor (sigma-70 family)